MTKERRISISIFITYSLLICFSYDFDFSNDAKAIFLWIFPLLCLLLYDFSLNKTIFYYILLSGRKHITKILKKIFNFIKEWITDFSKLLWHWFISIIPGGIIAAIGLYLSSIYHQNWIWNISGMLALIITVVLFTYNSRND